MEGGRLLSCDVDLVRTSDLAAFLFEQLERDMLIKILDLLLPLVAVQASTHELPLVCMQWSVSSEHEIKPLLAHEPFKTVIPDHVEFLSVLKYVLGALVRRKVDARWTIIMSVLNDRSGTQVAHLLGPIPRVLSFPPKASHDFRSFATGD